MSASLTALIIDDEPLARQELQYLLDAAGDVQVLAVGTNGIEAVDLIRTPKPDVIFLEVQSPGPKGFAGFRRFWALNRKAGSRKSSLRRPSTSTRCARSR